MLGEETPRGVRFELPAGFRLEAREVAPSARRSFRPESRPRRGRGPETEEGDVLIETLGRQDMDLLASHVIEGAPRRGARRDERSVRVEVRLEPGEDAAVLVERDGVYSWHFQEAEPAPRARRGARPERDEGRTAVFRFELDDVPAASGRRGFAGELLLKGVKTYVLKFAARLAVGGAMAVLERNVRPGVVRVGSSALADWTKDDGLAGFTPPADRPARLLLLIHGTFSSTQGSFGALTGFDDGRGFLERAIGAYDLVAGFDHRTLSEDPVANAAEILAHLEAIDWPRPPVVDAVSYSRGGLVFRSLVEHLLPISRFRGRPERSVFVGCANGGTQLAKPENWNHLIDLTTNLAIAAAKVGQAFPQTAPAAAAFEQIVEGLGPFVKYVAAYATDPEAVPGIAAMVPEGGFLRELNRVQPGQPGRDDVRYFAVTSAFDPRAASATPELSQIPRYLIGRLSSGLVRRLMGRDNDLVVDTGSMTAFDPGQRGILRDRHDFDRDPRVYHTVYFAQQTVAEALERWLEVRRA